MCLRLTPIAMFPTPNEVKPYISGKSAEFAVAIITYAPRFNPIRSDAQGTAGHLSVRQGLDRSQKIELSLDRISKE